VFVANERILFTLTAKFYTHQRRRIPTGSYCWAGASCIYLEQSARLPIDNVISAPSLPTFRQRSKIYVFSSSLPDIMLDKFAPSGSVNQSSL